MASAIIHLCIAKEVGLKTGYNNKELLIGSIAPDVAKIVGRHKNTTHFIAAKDDVPNIELFLSKYKNNLNSAFELGYFIHLYTDKLWYKYFVERIVCNNSIKLKDGTILSVTNEFLAYIIYNDYTNINIDLIDMYQLNLSLFYNEINNVETVIKEYPAQDTQKLIDKMGIIIANSKANPTYSLDLSEIESFIDFAVEKIIKKLDTIL